MPRLRSACTALLFCLVPALHAQGLASITRLNGRTELEGGASIMDFTASDADQDTRVSLTASASVLRWDDGQGSVRLHSDVLLGVDRWRWTLGPVVDFEDAARPGAGLRLSGGYEFFPHATAALSFETLTAPHDADGRSAGTHGSLGLMVRFSF
jgi:hypothetical protein